MKKYSIIFVFVAFLAMLGSCGVNSRKVSRNEPTRVRIGTFNLWRSDLGKGDYSWKYRKEHLAQAIVDNKFDIFAAEEVDTTMYRELRPLVEAKGGKYEWLTFSPYNAEGKGSIKAQAIVYRSDLFTVRDFHHFWCSETPDKMSTAWDEMKFKRGACCATFKEKASGREFFVMISHFPLGKEARLHFAPLVIERAKQYNPGNLPSFLLGDLNTRENRPESEILCGYWNDAFLTALAKSGPKGTFNGHNVEKDMEKAIRIDFIYWRGEGVTPKSYVCNQARYGDKQIYPSDHLPIYVDFEIK